MFKRNKKQLSNRDYLNYLRVEHPQEYKRHREVSNASYIYGMRFFW